MRSEPVEGVHLTESQHRGEAPGLMLSVSFPGTEMDSSRHLSWAEIRQLRDELTNWLDLRACGR